MARFTLESDGARGYRVLRNGAYVGVQAYRSELLGGDRRWRVWSPTGRVPNGYVRALRDVVGYVEEQLAR